MSSPRFQSLLSSRAEQAEVMSASCRQGRTIYMSSPLIQPLSSSRAEQPGVTAETMKFEVVLLRLCQATACWFSKGRVEN